jgi:hypothetical protein
MIQIKLKNDFNSVFSPYGNNMKNDTYLNENTRREEPFE